MEGKSMVDKERKTVVNAWNEWGPFKHVIVSRAGEWTDATGLQHLRARYLDTNVGRFTTKDTWGGD